MLARSLRRFVPAAALLLASAAARAETLKVPAQFDTIQEAVNAAATGDVVQVAKGVYAENVEVATPGITLKGKGATINGRYLAACVGVEADDFTIEGFTLVNGGSSALAAEPGDGVPPAALLVIGVGADISKLTIRSASGFGIFLDGTGSVEQCDVDACTATGILVETDQVLGTELTVIAKNSVTRCDAGIQAGDGPFTIEKNTVELCFSGIEVIIPPLFLEGGPVILATSISRNTVRHCSGAGLQVTKISGPTLLVEKNVIEENEFGVQLEGFSIDFDANTVDDNVAGGLAIFANLCNVTKNKVRGNGSFGIIVGAMFKADGGPAGENVLDKNTVQDNGGDGVFVISSDNAVTDCTIKGNAGDGIDLASGQSSNVVEGNKITDNEHDGIDNSAGNTVIADNQSKNNGGADIAGAGDGAGTVDAGGSTGNNVSDESDLDTFSTQGELDLDVPL